MSLTIITPSPKTPNGIVGPCFSFQTLMSQFPDMFKEVQWIIVNVDHPGWTMDVMIKDTELHKCLESYNTTHDKYASGEAIEYILENHVKHDTVMVLDNHAFYLPMYFMMAKAHVCEENSLYHFHDGTFVFKVDSRKMAMCTHPTTSPSLYACTYFNRRAFSKGDFVNGTWRSKSTCHGITPYVVIPLTAFNMMDMRTKSAHMPSDSGWTSEYLQKMTMAVLDDAASCNLYRTMTKKYKPSAKTMARQALIELKAADAKTKDSILYPHMLAMYDLIRREAGLNDMSEPVHVTIVYEVGKYTQHFNRDAITHEYLEAWKRVCTMFKLSCEVYSMLNGTYFDVIPSQPTHCVITNSSFTVSLFRKYQPGVPIIYDTMESFMTYPIVQGYIVHAVDSAKAAFELVPSSPQSVLPMAPYKLGAMKPLDARKPVKWYTDSTIVSRAFGNAKLGIASDFDPKDTETQYVCVVDHTQISQTLWRLYAPLNLGHRVIVIDDPVDKKYTDGIESFVVRAESLDMFKDAESLVAYINGTIETAQVPEFDKWEDTMSLLIQQISARVYN